MLIMRPEGTTRVLGQSQGFLGLPVRDEIINDSVMGETACIVTAWEPTPEELAALNAGAPVYLRLLCVTPPPVMVWVETAPIGDQEPQP